MYRLPEDISNKVLELCRAYKELETLATMEIEFEDYDASISPQYDTIRSSPTNKISRKTEELAIRHLDMLKPKNDATQKLRAIHAGIRRAAKTCKNDGDGRRIYFILEKNLLEGYSREKLKISPLTLTEYRKRALYFIALELGEYSER